MDEKYLMPTQEAGRKFVLRAIQGSVVMLNLFRFRDIADYSESPELMPVEPISGKHAYQLYIEHTLPFWRSRVEKYYLWEKVVIFNWPGKWTVGCGIVDQTK